MAESRLVYPSDLEKNMYDSLPMIMWMADSSGNVVYLNRAWLDFTGNSQVGVDPYSWASQLHPDDYEYSINLYQSCIRSLEDYDIDYRLRDKHGGYRWFHAQGRPYYHRNDDAPIGWFGVLTDIQMVVEQRTKIKRLENIIQTEKKLMQKIIEKVPMGTLILDNKSKLLYCNDRLYSIWRQKHEDGTTEVDWSKWQRKAYHADGSHYKPEDWPLSRSFKRGETVENELTAVQRDDDTIGILSISSCPIYEDNTDKVVAAVAFVEDYTSKSEAEKAKIEVRSKELSNIETAKMRSTFLTNVSHEMNTPLVGISGMVRVLKETELDDEQKDCVSEIDNSCSILTRYIADILDIVKIELGELELYTNTFSIRQTVDQVVKDVAASYRDKAVTIDVDISTEVPDMMIGDDGKLKQVLQHLLDNAYKFTESGKVVVKGQLTSREDADLVVRIDISDTGRGMSPETLKRVMKGFAQEDESLSRNQGGSGLGLSVSRGIVKLMGGELNVDSIKGKGSTFWFTVALQQAAPSKTMPRSEPPNDLAAKEKRSRKKILIVEDNKISQKVIQKTLAMYGYNTVELAENGLVAVEKHRMANSYSMILMDLQMPIMDGYEATARIRERDKLVPIVALSANATQMEYEKIARLGMSDYVAKPFNADVLINKMDKFLI